MNAMFNTIYNLMNKLRCSKEQVDNIKKWETDYSKVTIVLEELRSSSNNTLIRPRIEIPLSKLESKGLLPQVLEARSMDVEYCNKEIDKLDTTGVFEKPSLLDKFNNPLKNGHKVNVQKVENVEIYTHDDELCFKPYGEREKVSDYFKNDIEIVGFWR